MYLRAGKLRIHITFAFAVFVAFMCNSSAGERLMLTLVSACLHECVHLVFLIGYGCSDICLTLNPGGASVKCSGFDQLGEKRLLVVLLSAPAVNLITGALLSGVFYFIRSERLLSASLVNLSLGAVNLLPLSFLDGGRALRSALDVRYTSDKAESVARVTELFSLLPLLIVPCALAVSGYDWRPSAVFGGYCVFFVLSARIKSRYSL